MSFVQDLNSCRRVISYDDNNYTTGTSVGCYYKSSFAPKAQNLNIFFAGHVTEFKIKLLNYKLFH